MGERSAIVTIMSWPTGMDRAEAAAALTEALGLDPFIAAQRVAKPTPFVVARVRGETVESVKEPLQKRGVGVFVLTDKEMACVPAPIQAKRLEAAIGAPQPMYMVEPWRGEVMGVLMADVYCMVRAKVASARVGPPVVDAQPRRDLFTGVAWGVETTVTHERSSKQCNIIDLWLLDREHTTALADGRMIPGLRRVRINSEKFSWDVLGKERAHGSTESADRLALKLAEQAPGAAVELGFAAFKDSSAPALGAAWNSTPMGGARMDQQPAFEFYSAWCGVLHWRRTVVKEMG